LYRLSTSENETVVDTEIAYASGISPLFLLERTLYDLQENALIYGDRSKGVYGLTSLGKTVAKLVSKIDFKDFVDIDQRIKKIRQV
jgi:predicted transcriptional regulator